MGLGLGFGIGGRTAAVGGREERGVVARDGVCTAEQRGTSLLLECGAQSEPRVEIEPLARVAPAAAEGGAQRGVVRREDLAHVDVTQRPPG